MASQAKPRYTVNEYLAIERSAEFKSEYFDGYIVAMSGASEPHNLIVTNCVRELGTHLKGRDCRVYSYDRGLKFMKYRRIESLLEYLLVSQDNALVERYVRQPNDGWLMSEALGLDAVIHLSSIDCDLKLVEAYDKVRFSQEG